MGADIPGFLGNLDNDLYILFYQLGSFFPFARAHSHKYSTDREPYKRPLYVQDLVREAINLRYDLLPYM